jgi:L-fuculose-phosphate aldolase
MMMENKVVPWQEIARIGRKLVSSGLTSSRFGNISLKLGDKMFITCTGSMLDEIDERLVVEVDAQKPCPKDSVASIETCVHRAIYQSSSALAVIHTHSPYAVALSLLEDVIEPDDSEGRAFLGAIPVVSGAMGTGDLARNVSSALSDHKACVARGHGAFARGLNLTDAYTAVSMVEHSSQVKYLVEVLKKIK